MSDRDLDVPELHLALTTLAGERAAATRSRRRWTRRVGTAGRPVRPRPAAGRTLAGHLPAVRARAVAVLCVAAVALAGILAVSSPVRTPGTRVADGGAAAGRIAVPDLVRCALAALPEATLVDAGLDGAVLAAAEADRDAGRC